MLQINPYLSLHGQTREILSFYKQCIGGELTLQSVEESPMAAQWPAAAQKNILHGSLMKDNAVLLLASDMEAMEVHERVNGNAITLSLTCDTREELDSFFEKLSAGGTVVRAPHEFFAGTIAALKDKFGFDWLFYCTNK